MCLVIYTRLPHEVFKSQGRTQPYDLQGIRTVADGEGQLYLPVAWLCSKQFSYTLLHLEFPGCANNKLWNAYKCGIQSYFQRTNRTNRTLVTLLANMADNFTFWHRKCLTGNWDFGWGAETPVIVHWLGAAEVGLKGESHKGCQYKAYSLRVTAFAWEVPFQDSIQVSARKCDFQDTCINTQYSANPYLTETDWSPTLLRFMPGSLFILESLIHQRIAMIPKIDR